MVKFNKSTIKLKMWPWNLRQWRGYSSQHVVLICKTLVPNYIIIKILQCIREFQPGHEWLHINNKVKSATLTFEIGVWFFHVTRCLDMPNTCAKSEYENMRINTETANVTLTFEIGTWFFLETRRFALYANNLCQIILKSFHA